jgi:N-methylhydantoinase B
VSNGGSNAYTFAFGAVYDAAVRMLAASPDLRDEIVSGAFAGYGPASHAGIDQWGEEFGAMNLDVMGPSTGATAHHDGVDTGGIYIASPESPLPNIEENEMSMPMLYLFKREQEDYLGHGKYRSGVGMLYCLKPHRTEEVQNAMSANGSVLPIQRGLAGYTGNPLVHRIVRDSDAEEAFEKRQIPQDALKEAEMLPSKTSNTQHSEDLIVIGYASAPGYSDPVKRDPREGRRGRPEGTREPGGRRRGLRGRPRRRR